jgi:hypothetical protein
MTLCLQVSILITVPLRRGMMVCVSHVLGYTAGTGNVHGQQARAAWWLLTFSSML